MQKCGRTSEEVFSGRSHKTLLRFWLVLPGMWINVPLSMGISCSTNPIKPAKGDTPRPVQWILSPSKLQVLYCYVRLVFLIGKLFRWDVITKKTVWNTRQRIIKVSLFSQLIRWQMVSNWCRFVSVFCKSNFERPLAPHSLVSQNNTRIAVGVPWLKLRKSTSPQIELFIVSQISATNLCRTFKLL